METVQWMAGILCIAGLAFCVWARATLGRNWSGTITLKEGHELIERGPYRLVRHPIYTGLLAMFLATALAFGHLGGVRCRPARVRQLLDKAYRRRKAHAPTVPGSVSIVSATREVHHSFRAVAVAVAESERVTRVADRRRFPRSFYPLTLNHQPSTLDPRLSTLN